jgi:hypothetical protein
MLARIKSLDNQKTPCAFEALTDAITTEGWRWPALRVLNQYMGERGVSTADEKNLIGVTESVEGVEHVMVKHAEDNRVFFVLHNRTPTHFVKLDRSEVVYYVFNSCFEFPLLTNAPDHLKQLEIESWRVLRLGSPLRRVIDASAESLDINHAHLVVDVYTSRLVTHAREWSLVQCSVTGFVYSIVGTIGHESFKMLKRRAIRDTITRRNALRLFQASDNEWKGASVEER